jgi:hypothetical protein
MGQRYVQLESSYGATPDKKGFLRVSQMPPNPAIMAPGPALLFVVVDGVPSLGIQVMIGSGQLGRQKVLDVEPLPEPAMPKWTQEFKTSGAAPGTRGRVRRSWRSVLLSTVGVVGLLVFGDIIGF